MGPGTYFETCVVCSAKFKVRASYVAKAKLKGTSSPIYCSMGCRNERRSGSFNPKWRGGTIRQSSGYIYEYAPDHPHSTKQGYVMQHRLVVEREIGRILDPSEEVHHKNHIRDDNRFENLEVQPDRATHRVTHAYYEQSECPTCGTPVIRSIAHRRRHKNKYCSRKCTAAAGSARAKALGRNMFGKGATNPLRGREVPSAKLNDEAVRQIRSLVSEGMSQRVVGASYGVSQSTVSMVIRGKIWRHVK